MEQPLGKVHLVPAKRNKLPDPEGVAVGNQNHRCVSVPVPPDSFSGFDQSFDFGWRQEFPASPFRVSHSARWFH
jgi:hypothetical protein